MPRPLYHAGRAGNPRRLTRARRAAMLRGRVAGGVRDTRKPVEVRHGPATVTGERARKRSHCPRGREGRGSGDPGVRRLAFAPNYQPDRGEDPEEEVFMERNSLGRHIPSGTPLWSWLALALLLVMLFTALSASEALLAPLLGQAAGAADYLHEFADNGRHLLAVPCH